MRCSVCKQKKEADLTFFKVPNDERGLKWSSIFGKKFAATAFLCSDHFRSEDIIRSGRKFSLMPNAEPFAHYFKEEPLADNPETQKDPPNIRCVLGCIYPNALYKFPCRVNDKYRRNLWLDYFYLEDTNLNNIYACDRHFSASQIVGKSICVDAVPDVLSTPSNPKKSKILKKKKQNDIGSTNYLNDNNTLENLANEKKLQGVFGKNLLNINNNNIETLQNDNNPVLEIPILKPECNDSFTQTNTRLCGTVQVSEFADDYRFNCFFCCETFPLEKWKKFITHMNRQHSELEVAFHIPKYVSDDHDYTAISIPPTKSMDIESKKTETETLVIKCDMLPYLIESHDSSESHIETVVVNPLYYETLQNGILNDLNVSIPNSMNKHEIPVRHLPSTNDLKSKLKRNKFSSKTNSNSKKSKSKTLGSGVFYLKNSKRQSSNKTTLSRCLKRKIPKTKITEAVEPNSEPVVVADIFQRKSTELSFEYTTKDIIDLLLDTMENYPVLWEFNEQKFNPDYSEAIEDLCKIINKTWSLNIDNLKMRRTVNRVLRFYLSVYPLQNIENINQFTSYYDKCAEFLPKSTQDIAYARCPHCYMCFKRDYDLKFHLLEEKSSLQWPFKCVECKECFRDRDEYEFHKMLPHYQEVFRCEKCPKTFTHLNRYTSHVKNHLYRESDEPGKHKCNQCGKAYKFKNILSAHMLYHGEKKFKCHLCPKAFYESAKLKNHLKVHRKEFNFICEICSRPFFRQSSLDRHMDTHTKDKITCNICNLKLSKTSLYRHLRRVHVAYEGTIESIYRAQCHNYKSLFQGRTLTKPNKRRPTYHCKICDIHFEGLKLLLEHNKSFHPNRTKFSCKICSSEFSLKSSLKCHYRLKHNLHRYQIYKLINLKEDLASVLAIKPEEIEKLAETAKYHLSQKTYTPPKKYLLPEPTTTTTTETLIKTEPSPDKILIEEERIYADAIQDETLRAADNITSHEIKFDNEEIQIQTYTPRKKYRLAKTTTTTTTTETIIKTVPSSDKIFIKEERIHADAIQDEIMRAADNINSHEIKIDNDSYMNDFLTNLLI